MVLLLFPGGLYAFPSPPFSSINCSYFYADLRDTADLRNPPTLRGAIVIGVYHTHPYTASAADTSHREGLNNMGPSQTDEDRAFWDGVPDLVVYESGYRNGASELTAWGVGPDRRGGAPHRADPPANGFPGNGVDNRRCR